METFQQVIQHSCGGKSENNRSVYELFFLLLWRRTLQDLLMWWAWERRWEGRLGKKALKIICTDISNTNPHPSNSGSDIWVRFPKWKSIRTGSGMCRLRSHGSRESRKLIGYSGARWCQVCGFPALADESCAPWVGGLDVVHALNRPVPIHWHAMKWFT